MAVFLDEYAAHREAVRSSAQQAADAWRRYRAATGVDAGADDGLLGLDLEAVRTALDRHVLSLGVFGLIKRGKSTLVNALVGQEVSGAHVTPETAVPVYVEHGEQPSAEVRFIDGRTETMTAEAALRFTSQKHNENNHQGVLVVRQQVDSPLLTNGLRLVDTPGLDDADADDTYAEATLEEIRRVDAAIVTLLSPPTIGATEVAFLRTLAADGPSHVVFVLNMYPQHFHDPATRTEVATYVGHQLGAHLPDRDIDLFTVCAQEAWESRRDGDVPGWQASGLPELLRFLEERLTDRARKELVSEGLGTVERSARAMIDQARRRRALLTQPSALAEHRARVQAAAEEASNQLRTAVALAISAADRRHRRLRVAVEQSFAESRSELRKVETEEALKRGLRNVRRGVELRCTVAGRGLAESLQHTISELQGALRRAVSATEHLLEVPEEVAVEISDGSLAGLNLAADAQRLQPAFLRSLGSAAAGGALVGGVGAIAVSALLGPLGLVGGALAGWRLGGAAGLTGTLDRLKRAADERVESLASDVLRAYDEAATNAVEELRAAATRRVDAYAQELLGPLADVEQLAGDPDRVEAERRAVATLLSEISVILDEVSSVARSLDTVSGEPPASFLVGV